ncbi:MAG TPA: hypothetical protein VFU88_03465 [Ktedonobacterales bacterium]|nr:hypothetical protein [Ktedonobacterales bacterium]
MLLFLLLLLPLLGACSASTVTVVATATPGPPEPLFVTTLISVLAPAPAHAGDSVTVVTRFQAEVSASALNQRQPAATDIHLYGPFPSPAALQQAVAKSTASEGPPGWKDLLNAGGPGDASGGLITSTFGLPLSLAPGLYDLVVIATLPGGRAAARSDTPIQIVR